MSQWCVTSERDAIVGRWNEKAKVISTRQGRKRSIRIVQCYHLINEIWEVRLDPHACAYKYKSFSTKNFCTLYHCNEFLVKPATNTTCTPFFRLILIDLYNCIQGRIREKFSLEHQTRNYFYIFKFVGDIFIFL